MSTCPFVRGFPGREGANEEEGNEERGGGGRERDTHPRVRDEKIANHDR